MRLSCRKFSLLLLSPVLLLLLQINTSYSAEAKDGQWQFQLAPYAWLAGQNGSVATLQGQPAVDIDIDFWDDILGNINGAIFLVAEARKGRFGLLADVAYTDIELEENTPSSYFSSISSQTKTWMVTASGFYRVVDAPRTYLDVLAGVRYWDIYSRLKLSSGILPKQSVSNKENWFDPVVGVKGLSYFGGSKLFVSGGFSLGGFGVGSDLMWDAIVNLGYAWSSTFSATIGYRYLDVDYDDGGYIYDVAQNGPTVGLSWRF